MKILLNLATPKVIKLWGMEDEEILNIFMATDTYYHRVSTRKLGILYSTILEYTLLTSTYALSF